MTFPSRGKNVPLHDDGLLAMTPIAHPCQVEHFLVLVLVLDMAMMMVMVMGSRETRWQRVAGYQ
jgi:hypothetical protein